MREREENGADECVCVCVCAQDDEEEEMWWKQQTMLDSRRQVSCPENEGARRERSGDRRALGTNERTYERAGHHQSTIVTRRCYVTACCGYVGGPNHTRIEEISRAVGSTRVRTYVRTDGRTSERTIDTRARGVPRLTGDCSRLATPLPTSWLILGGVPSRTPL